MPARDCSETLLSTHVEGGPCLTRQNIYPYSTTATPQTAYADKLVIEQHGAVSHLIFCHTQKEFVGAERTVAVVDCRLIVPTASLARLARQLAHPPMRSVVECAELERATH
jgi:hypothetical protein